MPPLSSTQIKATYAEAMKLMSAGRRDAAEARFRTVLEAAPNLAEAHYQLGRLALARNAPEAALDHLEKARRIKPAESVIWQMSAEALARLDDPARQTGFLKQARAAGLAVPLLRTLEARLAGPPPAKEVQRAISLLDGGKAAAAEDLAASLLKRHPGSAVVALILANSRFMLGKQAAAEEAYKTAIRLAPDYAEAHNTYGRFLVDQGRVRQGAQEIGKALKLEPDLPLGLQNLGVALSQLGDLSGAIDTLKRAVEVEPRLAEAQLTLGRVLSRAGRDSEALDAFRKAAEQGHDGPVFLARMAQVQANLGDDDGALETLDAAVRKGPKNGLAHSLRALHLQHMGRFDAAEADFRKAIALEPRNGENYRMFMATARLQPGDPLIAQMEKVYADPSLPEESRMHLAFGLARAMEQVKQHDRVFEFLDPANAFWRKRYPYDISIRRAEIDRVKAAFADVDFAQLPPIEGTTGFAPIFVTGMPRSGTTLVEQILASHSRVDGAGELGSISGDLLRAMVGPKAMRQPPEAPGDAFLRDIGFRAEERLKAACPGAERVVDKAIQTYMFIGAVKRAMPNAHIVLVRRDPRDTLLSIYKNVFAQGTHRYAYNQRDLGLYYRMFDEIVDFWREKLPGGFYEIRYEDLIDNTEDEVRRLLSFCELEWEDQCMNFHETRRKVATLSVAQVRQPIYKSSQAAWKRHEADLAEMIEALGDAV